MDASISRRRFGKIQMFLKIEIFLTIFTLFTAGVIWLAAAFRELPAPVIVPPVTNEKSVCPDCDAAEFAREPLVKYQGVELQLDNEARW